MHNKINFHILKNKGGGS